MKAPACTLVREEDMKETWYRIDASGHVVGRVASRVAALVRGKFSPSYAPHQNPKIHVIVENADKAVFTGDKLENKKYIHHTTWRGGLRETQAKTMVAKKPGAVLRQAVYGMLPKNRLGRKLQKHVRFFNAGEYTNQHDAQQPKTIVLETSKPKVV